ncbi:S1/P1 nuclease [Pseudoalteromonas sp. TB64]|uniref:S1/P1 nuclease n=1 Tax=Pseudoalteromonas sp. TB64 TaxID=1938600 RepID=UPI00041EA7D2|nr:S1/P1 nuclease [Pseudoalteromonas sp. TB64]
MHNNLKLSITSALLISAVFTSSDTYAWGQNGHRIVGKIAEFHLSETTKTTILPYLNGESLAQISTWPDEMRSAPGEFWQKKSSRWHYINAAPNQPLSLDHSHTKTKESVSNILEGIHYSMQTLTDDNSSLDAKQFSLRFLVHLVGDSHQPFHAGRSEDRGGNSIKVKFFGQDTNLHSLWDTKLIENQNLSYTEFAQFIDTNNSELIAEYLQSTPTTWLEESRNLANKIYKSTNDEVSYSYIYESTPIIKTRLQQAGIRLAGLLNALFDPSAKELETALKMNTDTQTAN